MSAFIPPKGAVKFHSTNSQGRGLMWVMPKQRDNYEHKCRHRIVYRPIHVIRGKRLKSIVNERPYGYVCLCHGELVK